MSFKKEIPHKSFVAFECNAKSLASAIIFVFFFYSTANLDGLTKVSCQVFYIC